MKSAGMTKLGPLALTMSLLMACSNDTNGDSESRAPGSPTSPDDDIAAEYALAYPAGSEGTELVIQRAQKEARARPGQAGPYARLAQAFLRRKRETSDLALLAYARDALAAAAERDADDPEVLTAKILLLREDHRFQEAEAAARKLAAAAPDDATGPLLLGDARLELGDYEGAIQAYQRALDLQPDLRSYSRAAYVRWLHGDHAGALELMEDALGAAGPAAREPVAWCYVDLGEMLRHRGRPEAALRASDRALDLVEDYAPALALRGRALRALGRPDEAISALEAAIERRADAELLLALGEILERRGRAEEASALFARARGRAAHDPLPVARHLARRGEDPGRAVDLAERALEERKNVFSWNVYALALLRTGEIEEARRASERALRLGTPLARFHLVRGLIDAAAGDAAAAGERLERARALDPGADPRLSAELERELGPKTARLEGRPE